MAPIREGHDEQLLGALAAMPTGRDSPFTRIATTHFVRWLLIPALLGGDDEPSEPAQAYLLFSADFDGPLEDWLTAVTQRIGVDFDGVFDHCHCYPGSDNSSAFLAFVREHRIDVGFSVVSYRASVAAIHESLALRGALREFAIASQGLGPDELRSAWRERFVR